jgi:hypothetical protein
MPHVPTLGRRTLCLVAQQKFHFNKFPSYAAVKTEAFVRPNKTSLSIAKT